MKTQHMGLARSARGTRPDTTPVTVTFALSRAHAPAFRAALQEFTDELTGRMDRAHSFDGERSLTAAMVVLGALRNALSLVPAARDPHFPPRR